MASTATRHKFFTTLFFAAVVFYWCFHTIHGEQGLYALLLESHRQERLEAELETLRNQRIFMEHKVALMREGAVDPDLLDEEVRRYLGYAGQNELVVISPPLL